MRPALNTSLPAVSVRRHNWLEVTPNQYSVYFELRMYCTWWRWLADRSPRRGQFGRVGLGVHFLERTWELGLRYGCRNLRTRDAVFTVLWGYLALTRSREEAQALVERKFRNAKISSRSAIFGSRSALRLESEIASDLVPTILFCSFPLPFVCCCCFFFRQQNVNNNKTCQHRLKSLRGPFCLHFMPPIITSKFCLSVLWHSWRIGIQCCSW